ncbi:MAG: hypothetical protein JW820_10130 [Spirochaetales bacterium]|nr:hypothetical protein [Spirochaetales bacterium]
MRKAAACTVLVVLLRLAALQCPVSAFGQDGSFSWEGTPDWERGVLVLETRTPVDPAEVRPDLRYRTQRRVERLLPELAVQALLATPLDSFYTVGERIEEDEELFQALSTAAAAGAVEESASLSRDLGEVRIRYRLPFYGPAGLASPFVSHGRPFPLQPVLGFVPSRPFSGLVIYATGELPAHGKETREQVRPAFFPRLFDEQLNLVLSADMCSPDALRRWGLAAYRYSEDRAADLERVGNFPLRTVARGVFGKNSTDLLLSGEAVRQLLSLEANRKMLQEGRILIVVDPPQVPAPR